MFPREPAPSGREFSAVELPCLELMQLLSQAHVDQAAVGRVVSSDPTIAMHVYLSAVPVLSGTEPEST